MEEIASVYARAVFEAAEDAGRLDEVREQLGQVADAVEGDRNLSVFFFSPYFSSDEKKEGLSKMLTDADPLVHNTLELLIDNHRMPLLFRIRREYDRLWEQENDILHVDVTSAVELDEKVVKQIGERVEEQTNRRVELASRVDPDILGGIVVQVGNSIIDASIRTRLHQLRRQVARAT